MLVTRAAEDAPVLAHALALAGYSPVVVPLLERRWLPLAVADLAVRVPSPDVVVITSATAAEVVATGAPTAWRGARWAAVGPSTAERLRELGYDVVLVSERATADDLTVALGDLSGQTVVFPRADLAPPTTADGLRRAGATVEEVVAYENVAPVGSEQRLRGALPVTATTLLSGSAAERLAAHLTAAEHVQLGRIVAIGPSTARAATRAGLVVHAVADLHTVDGVVAAVRRVLTRG